MRVYENLGEGKIFFAYYEHSEGVNVIYPFIRREIPDTTMYDITTIYGYSGPVLASNSSVKFHGGSVVQGFNTEFNKYCIENNIVSEFIRFHPLIQNHMLFQDIYNTTYVRDTVKMDLDSADQVWNNIHSKKRNMIRKASKNNVEVNILESPSKQEVEEFYHLYIETMKKQEASADYFFEFDFFYNTFKLLEEKALLVNAVYEGEVVSSSIILLSYPYGHYHFSGTNPKGLRVAANDLLLYEVSMHLLNRGYKEFHLGGGYKDNSDPLFKFKKRFSKEGSIPFYVGKKVHMQEEYKRITVEKGNDLNTEFFPSYRA